MIATMPEQDYIKYLQANDAPLVTTPEASVEELKHYSWILLGWGCDLGKNADKIKKLWLGAIKAAGIRALGLEGTKVTIVISVHNLSRRKMLICKSF